MISEEAKQVLESMTPECRARMHEIFVPGWVRPDTEPNNDGEWWVELLPPNEPDAALWPFCPCDPTAIMAEAAKMLGATTINPEDARWSLCQDDDGYTAEVWFGPGCSSEWSGGDVMSAALQSFRRAFTMAREVQS